MKPAIYECRECECEIKAFCEPHRCPKCGAWGSMHKVEEPKREKPADAPSWAWGLRDEG